MRVLLMLFACSLLLSQAVIGIDDLADDNIAATPLVKVLQMLKTNGLKKKYKDFLINYILAKEMHNLRPGLSPI